MLRVSRCFFKTIIMGVLLGVSMSGCATLVKGTSQSITVNTKPTGATCTLSREDKTIAIVNPTPGTVSVDKDKDDISVLCKKDEYNDSTGVLSSKLQGMTFGNILLGGLIGVAIDAGSGAMTQYDSMMIITMIPKTFESFSDRDEFFDSMKNDYVDQYSKLKERMISGCEMIDFTKENEKEQCMKEVSKVEKEKNNKLAEVELQRNESKVLN